MTIAPIVDTAPLGIGPQLGLVSFIGRNSVSEQRHHLQRGSGVWHRCRHSHHNVCGFQPLCGLPVVHADRPAHLTQDGDSADHEGQLQFFHVEGNL